MDESELKARLQYFDHLTAKYGFHVVPANDVYRAFEEIVRPERMAFVFLKTGLFGKKINDDIVHLIKFVAYKGFSYGVRWGISLAWVPNELGPKPKWHRTLKGARFDLFEDALDYLVDSSTPWQQREIYYIKINFSERRLREELSTAWRNLRPEVEAWFRSTITPEDVLEKASAQVRRTWSGPPHYPPPWMVYAFTLARLGRVEEALSTADHAIRAQGEGPASLDEVRNALLRISRD